MSFCNLADLKEEKKLEIGRNHFSSNAFYSETSDEDSREKCPGPGIEPGASKLGRNGSPGMVGFNSIGRTLLRENDGSGCCRISTQGFSTLK